MPKHPLGYLAFTSEFIHHMERRGGFPPDKAIRKWFHDNRNGAKPEYLADVKHGLYAPSKCAAGIIEMLLEPKERQDTYHAKLALADYMRDRGIGTLSPKDNARVLSHVCALGSTPPEESYDMGVPEPFWNGALAVACFPLTYSLQHAVIGCRPYSDDLNESIRWMFIRVAQMTFADGPTMSDAQAIAAAAKHITVELPVYQERAKLWYDHNPWTVVRAKGRGNAALGMSIVLPLSPAAYEDVLECRRHTSALVPADFVIPSNHLLLEACAENPSALGRPLVALHLVMCLTAQLAAFMRYGNGNKSNVFKWISFAGTPTTRDRLLSTGFQATGRKMAVSGVEILERKLDFDSGDTRLIEGLLLGVCASKCPAAPPLS